MTDERDKDPKRSSAGPGSRWEMVREWTTGDVEPPAPNPRSQASRRPPDLPSEESSTRTGLSASGRPAVSRGGDAGPTKPRISGHRRRSRGPGGGADEESERSNKRVIPADVDLGLAADLPDRPVEEAEAERRAMEVAQGKSPARSTWAFFAALLFLLPFGLLLGARQLERVQRERAAPESMPLETDVVVGADAADRLPLLEPLTPYRAPTR